MTQHDGRGTMALATLDAEVREIALEPVFTTEVAITRMTEFRSFVSQVMKKDEDYGTIPGTKKDTLYKPGAEKLLELYGLGIGEPQIRMIEDWENGFWMYDMVLPIVKIATGQVIGYGVGSCNSKEERYRWRNVVSWHNTPPCNQTECDPRGKQRGYVCPHQGHELFFGQNGAAWKKKVENDARWDLPNCVTPETRVLTRDLRWVMAGDIVTGDCLIGVEEIGKQYGRLFKDAEAIVYGRREDDLYEVRMDDGRVVRCNGEHKWLVRKVGLGGTEWVETAEIFRETRTRRGRPRMWKIMGLCTPWESEDSKEAGYMAGLFDADGAFSGGTDQKYQPGIVKFAQQSNGVLMRMEGALATRGFRYGKYLASSPLSREPVFDLSVSGGLPEQMRLLGTIRPPRLLDRWNYMMRLEERRFEGRPIAIESVEPVGVGEIVMLGTTAGTYIAEGLVAHNTIKKMAKKRAVVDGALSVTRSSGLFTQDIEDMGRTTQRVIAGDDDEPKARGRQAQRRQTEAPENPPEEQPVDLEAQAKERRNKSDILFLSYCERARGADAVSKLTTLRQEVEKSDLEKTHKNWVLLLAKGRFEQIKDQKPPETVKPEDAAKAEAEQRKENGSLDPEPGGDEDDEEEDDDGDDDGESSPF